MAKTDNNEKLEVLAEKLNKNIQGDDNRLLLAVTGGIASGKSTVSQMLEEAGSPLIDFDVLARVVVEPGKNAWKNIVDYFGEEVLQEDRTLDRKKLSDIVFQDDEKRKMLEGFIHPQTMYEFIKMVTGIVKDDPNAIIQVAVPLLFEVKMQHLFHKTLVVYTSKDKQVERLVQRDSITPGEAGRILNAQMPIDKKVSLADYVINNEGSIEETKKQVDELWQKLQVLQEEKKA